MVKGMNVAAALRVEKAKQQGIAHPIACGFKALNDGARLPVLGLGCYRSTPGRETYSAVLAALRLGYRHIDTAEYYDNEQDVGKAIRDSGVPRDEVFVSTKFFPLGGMERARVRAACAESLQKLGTHIDLYLLHSPGAANDPHRDDAWKEMEALKGEGLVRSIGVSNYGVRHLQHLLGFCKVQPAVNQIELSPFLTRNELVRFCDEHNIAMQAYSPLTKGRKLSHPTLAAIAGAHSVTPAQVLIRWSVQRGFVVIPKTVKQQRLIENADVFGFALTDQEMETLNGLDENLVTGWDPTDIP